MQLDEPRSTTQQKRAKLDLVENNTEYYPRQRMSNTQFLRDQIAETRPDINNQEPQILRKVFATWDDLHVALEAYKEENCSTFVFEIAARTRPTTSTYYSR